MCRGPEGKYGYTNPQSAIVQDIFATLECLSGEELTINYGDMLYLPSIGDPIIFTDDEQAEFEDPNEIPAWLACEQSLYWSGQGGVDCSEIEVMYCCSKAEIPYGALAQSRVYHPDYLGSVEFVTDMKGEAYQPVRRSLGEGGFFLNTIWGENLQNQLAFNMTAFSSRFRFNGKEWDEETGNFYYGARYYDPKVSVWLSVDAMTTKGPDISPYSFSNNNPLNFVDPDWNWPYGWWGVTYLFNKAQAVVGMGLGIQGVSQKGVAYDQVGVTHFHMIANYKIDATESGKTETVGGLMGSWTFGIRQDYANETFYGSIMEEGPTFSAGAAFGGSGGIEFGDGLIGGEIGFGLGFLVENAVTEVKESISVTDAQADAINSQMGGGNGRTWSIDQETVRYNQEVGYWEANVAARTTNKVTTEVVVRSYDRKVWMSQEYLDQAIKAELQ